MASARRVINPRFFENQKQPDGIVDRKISAAATTTNVSSQNSFTNVLKIARKSGSINLSNRQLTECPIEVFTISDTLDSDEKFWEITSLSKIDLSYNQISDLPDLFEKCLNSTLQSFKIRDNQLVDLPSSLSDCRELWHLDVAMNKLQDIQNINFEQLCELKELFLFENQISSLPISLTRCISLQFLDAHHNLLSSLPSPVLIGLKNLVKLNVKHNKLTTLPSDLSDMTLLEFLDVSENLLEFIPDLTKLCKLSFLDASQNKVKELPLFPIHGSLDRLHIGHNRLTTLTTTTAASSNENLSRIQSSLSELLIHDNNISVLPSDLSLFVKLRVIDITNNNVTDIPASLGYNKALQRLQIEGNPIRTIRRTLLTQSTEELKKYLRTRGGPALSLDRNKGVLAVEEVEKVESRLGKNSITTTTTTTSDNNNNNKVASVPSISKSKTTFEYTEEGELVTEEVDRLLLYRVRDMSSTTTGGGVLDLSNLSLTYVPISSASEYLLKRSLDLSSVMNLNLSGNQLSLLSIIEAQLCLLTGLKVLDLSGNFLGNKSMSTNSNNIRSGGNLSSIGKKVGLLLNSISDTGTSTSTSSASMLLPASIQRLNLSRTNITSTDLSLLLQGLSQLTELNVANNVLRKIPSEISSFVRLRELLLSSNQISCIDNIQFTSLLQLEVLDLSSNLLSDIHSLANCSLSSLRSVNLQYNNITVIPAQFGTHFPNLTYLGLYGNPQKSIRSNMINNTEAILLFLRNKVSLLDVNEGVNNHTAESSLTSSSIPSSSSSSSVLKPVSQYRGEQENLKIDTSNRVITTATNSFSSSLSTSKPNKSYNNDNNSSSPPTVVVSKVDRKIIPSSDVCTAAPVISIHKSVTSTPSLVTATETVASSSSSSSSQVRKEEEQRRLELLINRLENELDHFSTSKSRMMEIRKELAVTRAGLSRLLSTVQ